MKFEFFSALDWLVVAAYIVGTTTIGHLLKGKQQSTKDFFLAGRTLPWFAVSGSIIATTISAITFIGVPAMLYATQGNFTYLQLALGGIIAKILIARYFIPLYYKKDFYSPYDFMADRLGPVVGRITSAMFFIGAILGQGVRVYATALVLEIVTGLTLVESVLIISAFSILWTWMGGIATVVWTDFVQFFIFLIGGILALSFLTQGLPGSWTELVTAGAAANKFKLFDFSTDPRVAFTFWAALIALPFQNLAAYGTDQLNTQRLLCCKSPSDARKALYWSISGELVTLLMMMVGVGLFAFYQVNTMPENFAALLQQKGDRVFPVFIVSVLPAGVKGLLIACIFAAAISSLDSVLAALSQTSLTMFYKPLFNPEADEAKLLRVSKIFVLIWGVILAVMAWACAASQTNLVTLAFSMTTYTYGPMLGVFLLAVFSKKIRIKHLGWSAAFSVLVVFLLNKPELLNPIFGTRFDGAVFSWPWMFPIGTLVCFLGAFRAGKKPQPVESYA